MFFLSLEQSQTTKRQPLFFFSKFRKERTFFKKRWSGIIQSMFSMSISCYSRLPPSTSGATSCAWWQGAGRGRAKNVGRGTRTDYSRRTCKNDLDSLVASILRFLPAAKPSGPRAVGVVLVVVCVGGCKFDIIISSQSFPTKFSSGWDPTPVAHNFPFSSHS